MRVPIELLETVVISSPEIEVICSLITIDYFEQEIVVVSMAQNLTVYLKSLNIN